MDEAILRAEHDEFGRRIDEEQTRQNRRIESLEQGIARIEHLNVSIERLAMNMESMVKEQARQGERLEALENRDGEKWRTIVKYVLTTVVGILIGFVFKQIGL